MRHIGKLAGAAFFVLTPIAAFAQTGAAAGAPMQPGSWGQGGWQAGTPGVVYAPAQQAYVQQAYSQPGSWQRAPTVQARDYRRLDRGKRVPRAYLDPAYTVSDWNDWGFATPASGLRWIRYYDDGLLIDADGRVVDARYGIDWNRGRANGPRMAYAGGAIPYAGYAGYPAAGAPIYGYAGGATVVGSTPGVTTYRVGPDTTVTTSVVQVPPVIVGAPAYGYASAVAPAYGYAGGATTVAPAYGYAGGATTVAPAYGYAGGATTVAPAYGYAGGATALGMVGALAVTTTTTTTDYETVHPRAVVKSAARRRPVRHYRPRCVRAVSCPVQGS